MAHVGCKHLDYEKKHYPTCKIVTIEPEGIKFWERPSYHEGQVTKVQFCKLRGRINEIFDCIFPTERVCYEDLHEECEETNCEYFGRCENDPQRSDYCPLHNVMTGQKPLTAKKGESYTTSCSLFWKKKDICKKEKYTY